MHRPTPKSLSLNPLVSQTSQDTVIVAHVAGAASLTCRWTRPYSLLVAKINSLAEAVTDPPPCSTIHDDRSAKSSV